jgi:hypothetical protein
MVSNTSNGIVNLAKDLLESGILGLLPKKEVKNFGTYRLLFYYLSEVESKLFFGKSGRPVIGDRI